MKKKLLSVALIASLVLSAAGCGETGSSDEINLDNIEEKIDNMSDDEIEQAFIDGADTLGEEIEDITSDDTSVIDETEEYKEVTAPVQEIIDADFSSLKVQINGDIFQQGGYITVAELAEQCREKYDLYYMYKGTYTDCAEYMIEYVKPDYNGGYKNNWLKLVPKQGNAGAAIIAYVANISCPDNKITLAETAVLYLDEHPDNQRGVDVSMWSPNGFLKTSVSYDNPTAYESSNGSYNLSNFPEYLESVGFKAVDKFSNDYLSHDMNYSKQKNSLGNEFVAFYVKGEPTPSGLIPVYQYTASFDENTEKLKTIGGILIGLFTQ